MTTKSPTIPSLRDILHPDAIGIAPGDARLRALPRRPLPMIQQAATEAAHGIFQLLGLPIDSPGARAFIRLINDIMFQTANSLTTRSPR